MVKPVAGKKVLLDIKGIKRHYLDGLLHREDGPALVYPDGKMIWYKYGSKHRTDGPAIINPFGPNEWYQNDTRYREDGPTVVHLDNKVEWWLGNTKFVHFLDWCRAMKKTKEEIVILKLQYGE